MIYYHYQTLSLRLRNEPQERKDKDEVKECPLCIKSTEQSQFLLGSIGQFYSSPTTISYPERAKTRVRLGLSQIFLETFERINRCCSYIAECGGMTS